jgi:predicted enzyme related to lactoylglutathione lyase
LPLSLARTVSLASIGRAGGETVREPYAEGDLRVATFRDPAGNVIGIWQMSPR